MHNDVSLNPVWEWYDCLMLIVLIMNYTILKIAGVAIKQGQFVRSIKMGLFFLI